MTLRELFDKKGKAYAAWRELNDRAAKEGRDLTAEEKQQIDAWEREIDECDEGIKAKQDQMAREKRLAEIEESLRQPVEPLRLQHAGNDGANAQRDPRNIVEKF